MSEDAIDLKYAKQVADFIGSDHTEGKRFRRGRKVGIFIAEQFVGDLSGQQNANIGVFMNPFR